MLDEEREERESDTSSAWRKKSGKSDYANRQIMRELLTSSTSLCIKTSRLEWGCRDVKVPGWGSRDGETGGGIRVG